MSRPQFDHETTASTADMAEIIGVSPRRLQQLAAEGLIEGKIARDEWNIFRTVHTHLAHCIYRGRKAA